MIAYICALLLVMVCLLGISLRKAYNYLPLQELKRQARNGDTLAGSLYQAAAYGPNLRLLLWAVIALSAAASFSLLAHLAPTIIAFVAISLVLIYGFAWLPSGELTSFSGRLAIWATPVVIWLLAKLHPVLNILVRYLGRFRPPVVHSGLYEPDDLADLLNRQKQQPDSRIAPQTIDLMLQALAFQDLRVSNVLTPRSAVNVVKPDDAIGPILLDELHDSGHTRFPVYDPKSDSIVGLLHLQDVVDSKQSGSVRSLMQPKVIHVHEDHFLEQALHAVIHSNQQLLIVINSHQEYVGIVSFKDIVAQLIGHAVKNDFEQYDDRAAVAAHPAAAETRQTNQLEATETNEAISDSQ